MPLKNYDSSIGENFGGLKLIHVDDFVEKGKRRKCKAKCFECGETKEFRLNKLLEGNYKSCGCSQRNRKIPMKVTDYNSFVGKTINNYRILENESADNVYKVECVDCKTIKRLDRYKLVHDRYGKCQCMIFHNMAKTDLYNRWKGMKNRCLNPNAVAYKDYGARGIKVCEEWKNDFTQFYEDMGEPPTPKHQLDRIDNNGNYEKNNCRWVLPLGNVNNQRDKTNNKTGYSNVYARNNKYETGFEFNKQYHHVGTFDNAEQAYEACKKAKEEFLKTVNYNDIV